MRHIWAVHLAQLGQTLQGGKKGVTVFKRKAGMFQVWSGRDPKTMAPGW